MLMKDMDRSNFKIPEKPKAEVKPIKAGAMAGISLTKTSNVKTTDSIDQKESENIVTETIEEQNRENDEIDENVIPNETSDPEQTIVPTESIIEETNLSNIDEEPRQVDNSYDFTNLVTKKPKAGHWTGLKIPKLDNHKKLVVITSVAAAVITVALVSYLVFRNDNTESSAKLMQYNAEAITGKAINSADFIVFGLNKESAFSASVDDFRYEAQNASIIVEARSLAKGDDRLITISEQKVPSNFETDPYGLKNLLNSIGEVYKVSSKYGVSYIVKSGATAFAVRGETLIFIRTTASLTTEEWIRVFDNLQPIVYSGLGL